MEYRKRLSCLKCALMAVMIVFPMFQRVNAQTAAGPEPFLVHLSDTTTNYQEIFPGPPKTASMHSGLVVLTPGTSVGRHSTKKYEEAIVVLSGSGEFRVTGGPTLQLSPNSVAYCPPKREHDVVNTGTAPLRYIYIAAKHEK